MSLFRTTNDPRFSDRELLQSKITLARNELLWVFVLTMINIVMLAVGGDLYMIFSIAIPFAAVDLGMMLCGKYPPEYYTEGFEDMEFLPENAFFIFLAIGILLASLLLLAYLLSKKRIGWLAFGLAYVCIDLVFNLVFYVFSVHTVIDIVFHVIMIVSIERGLNAHSKLKKLPAEEPAPAAEEASSDQSFVAQDIPNSTPLRAADLTVKSRTLLEHSINGHKIVYRRVKRTNELVIDNYVYGEYTALAELSHALTATVDGHTYTVGFDSRTSRSFLVVDNITVLEKMRWY